jgi:poly-gamma-glutamate synthesis protein (capsule biosynthesis protein)
LGSGEKEFHDSKNSELKEIIREEFVSLAGSQADSDSDHLAQIGITSHHLPTALPLIVDFYEKLKNMAGPREVFVILGPDHFEKCQSPITTSKIPYLTPFGQLAVDEQIVEEVIRVGAFIDDKCFENEHSVAVQTIFIKYLFPNAKIVPILFSANTANQAVVQLADKLSLYKDRVIVIASLDFSHYKKVDEAIEIDAESEKMIKNLDTTLLDIKHLDSPPVIDLVILLAKKFNATQLEFFKRANSFDFTGETENTTGYISAIFGDRITSGNPTILFVGDLMFDRNIRQAAQKNGNEFIFEKIASFLAENDLVVANLEGPITENKSISLGSAPGSNNNFIFTFDPSLAETLFKKNIKIVNLGNNHILNFEQKGLAATKKYLTDENIEYFGEPGGQKSLLKEIEGVKTALVSFNQFVDNIDSEKTAVVEEIKKAKARSDITVLLAHWGTEYAPAPNETIKNLAHQFIDAGADLVVGAHPHIIQPVEDYKGKKIYYSLGNFVFDQYFSQGVRRGLGVLIKINQKTKKFEFEEKNFYLAMNGQTVFAENE